MGYLDNAGLGVLWKNIVGKSIPYGYCTTGASTRAKAVTVAPAITELTAGVQILVKFQYANTASTTSSAVTLNVNGLGAKQVKRYGSTNISNSAATSWNANSVVLLTYDGTYWQLTDYNNTTYSAMSVAEYEAGTGTSARLMTPERLKAAIEHWATGEANVQSDWEQTDSSADDFIKNKPTIPTKTSDLTNDSGFITGYTETDPVFTASPAYGITAQNITSWNNKVNKSGDIGLGDMMFQTGSGIGLKFQGDNVDKVVRLNGFGGAAGYNLYFRGFDVGVSGNNPVSLLNIADPTSEQGAATKKYVDDNKVSKSGDTMSGDLGFAQFKSPVWNYNVNDVSKQVSFGINGTYSDGTNVFSTVVFNDVTDNLPVILGNVATPQNIYDATNKRYVDAQRDSRVPNSRKINNKALSADITLTASDVGALSSSTSIPTKTSDLTNDSGFSTFSGSYTDLTNKPTIPTSTSDLTNDSGFLTTYNAVSSENGTEGNVFLLSVNGSTAGLYFKSGGSVSFYDFIYAFQSIAGVTIAQVIGGTSEAPTARVYEIAELDASSLKVRLVSVDNGVVYTADLQGSDYFSALTGTFSSQTIPTGGITTETDPTVPAWAKASSKPSYGADEISFDNTQQTQYLGNATNVNTALTSLDYALDNAEHDINNISSDYFSKSGGTITGDLTLKSNAATNSKSIIFQRGTLTDNYNDWQIQDRGGFLYFDQRGTNSSSFSNQVCFNTSGNVQATTFNGYSLAGASAKAVDTSISAGSSSTNLPTSQAVASFVEGKGYLSSVGADEVQLGLSNTRISDLANATDVEQGFNVIDTFCGQIRQLPAVTSSDNGKVLRVVNGAWSAVALPSASGVSF